ncbi:MAG TPA: PilZ domain-containing protein [Thermodesulfovibrionales bacterium]|nr:PilZ domain-containing protein [Thermodesulfovibrionales bacterium]
MGIRDNLKNIIRDHLGKSSSSIFLNKSLAILDESADSEESLTAVADRIGNRIALFIDEELARKVLEDLKTEIKKAVSPPEEKRKHVRVSSSRKVSVIYDGSPHELYTENLSEGGMYILTNAPFPIGKKLEMVLDLNAKTSIHLKGVVIYIKRPFSDVFEHPSGMAIEFREINDNDRRLLRDFIKRTSDGDVPEGSEAAISKPVP